MALILERIGKEPRGACLKIKAFEHDFGKYLEVVCRYDSNIPESLKYALRCESDSPTRWDE
jgi:hypothetical protein